MEIDFEEILDCISGGAALYEVGTPLKTLMFTDGIPRMQGFTREEYAQEITEDAMHMVFEAMCQHIPDPQIRSRYASIFKTGQPTVLIDGGTTMIYEEQERAEDHALNAQIIKKILENYGYQVHMQYVKA